MTTQTPRTAFERQPVENLPRQSDGRVYFPDNCDHGTWIGQTCPTTGNLVQVNGDC